MARDATLVGQPCHLGIGMQWSNWLEAQRSWVRWFFFFPLAIVLCALLESLVSYIFGARPLGGSRMSLPSELLGTHIRKLVSSWSLVALPAIAVRPRRAVSLVIFWLGAILSMIPVVYDLYRGTWIEVLYAVGAAGVDLLGAFAGLATVRAYVRAMAGHDQGGVVPQ